jgi:uncharacterized BrkB/YihY/UPF0761 family membrane protein
METKATIISGLLILGLLTVWYGIISWIFSILNRFGMPAESYLIVAGLLTIIFATIAAKMFTND